LKFFSSSPFFFNFFTVNQQPQLWLILW